MLSKQDGREKDIQKLCEGILGVSPDFYDNPNGGYEYSCPFCLNWESFGNVFGGVTMKDVKHDPDCPYLIAKDLMTNLKPQQ